MVRGVLHDVMQHTAHRRAERQVDGRRHERRGRGPAGLVGIPGHAGVRVMHVDDEADHPVPEDERHDEAHRDQPPRRLSGRHRGGDQSADPDQRAQGHAQAVPQEGLATGRHHLLARKHHATPPDLDQVVQPRRPAAAVHALQRPPPRRQGLELLQRARLPDEVEALQVGVAVVHHVVPHIPQAVGRHGRQKDQPPQPAIQCAVGGQALVAGIVSQDEEAADHEAGGQARQQLQRRMAGANGGHEPGHEQQDINAHQPQRVRGAARSDRRQPRPDQFAMGHRGLWGQRLGGRGKERRHEGAVPVE